MENRVSGNFRRELKTKLPVMTAAILYFGLLAYTMYLRITKEGVTGSILRLAVVVSAFALGSYIMFFYTKNKLRKRHVTQNSEMEFGITKVRVLLDKIIAVLFLVIGAILMILTVL